MSLDLTLPPSLSSRGRPAKEVNAEFLRPLEPQDIALILNGEVGWRAKPLQKLRAAHHTIAFLLVSGDGDAEVSRKTGRSTSSIQALKQDPAFQQLLSSYSKMGDEARADVFRQAADLSSAALAELQERVEQEPETFTNKELLEVSEKLMDRTGLGPSKTIKTFNGADVVKELVRQKEAERAGRVIDPEEA